MTASMSDRPRWSASQAARECGVGRTTIQRALAAGKFPNAEQGEHGWSIPVEDLIAAGFQPGKPSPPDPGHARNSDRSVTGHPPATAPDTDRRVLELEAELTAERARREAAEQHARTAELLASERERHVEDLRRALRMLEPAVSDRAPEQQPTTAAQQPTGTGRPGPAEQVRRLFDRWR